MSRSLIIKLIALIASAWLGVMVAGLIALIVGTVMSSGGLGGEFLMLFFMGSAMGLPTICLLVFVQLVRIILRWYRGKNLIIPLSAWAMAIALSGIIVLLVVLANTSSNLVGLWLFISCIQVPVVLKSQAIAERLLTAYFPE